MKTIYVCRCTYIPTSTEIDELLIIGVKRMVALEIKIKIYQEITAQVQIYYFFYNSAFHLGRGSGILLFRCGGKLYSFGN